MDEFYAAILRYMHPANETTQQCADDLEEISYMVADAYDKGMLNDICIEQVGLSICHSLRHY